MILVLFYIGVPETPEDLPELEDKDDLPDLVIPDSVYAACLEEFYALMDTLQLHQ